MFLLHKVQTLPDKANDLFSHQEEISQHLPGSANLKNRMNTTLETVSRFITSVSFGKRVLTRFTVA